MALLDDGTGGKQTVIAVQVPGSFSASNPCIVLGASSGSRGVYGAIGTAGEWGLKKGCAVALTDAGYGIQFGGALVTGYGRTLAEYTTWGNIHQPCAALAGAYNCRF